MAVPISVFNNLLKPHIYRIAVKVTIGLAPLVAREVQPPC